MKYFSMLLVFLFLNLTISGQNLVGYSGKEIIKYMKENRKELHSDKVVNPSFTYLKYGDSSDSQTLLFFLDKDSVCSGIRMVYDVALKPEKVKELNTLYKKRSENVWTDKLNGKDYLIVLKDDSWSCTVTIQAEK